jgi:hypothetical protein
MRSQEFGDELPRHTTLLARSCTAGGWDELPEPSLST